MKLYKWIFFVFLALAANSCDTCDINSSGGNGSIQKIFFTASVANAEATSIYSINKNLNDLNQIVEDGIIFSAPSNTGYFTYLKFNNERKELHLFDLNNNSSKLIASESPIFGVYNPILSSDGSRIAINAGDGKLIIYNNDNSGTFNQVSSVFEDNSTTAFSPDSKLLAFVEKNGESSFKIKVIDAVGNSSLNVIYENEYNFDAESPNYFHFFSWLANSEKLYFSTNNSDSSHIIFIDIINKEERKVSFDAKNIKLFDLMISPDGKYAAFINLDGNLWVLQLQNNDYRFYKISQIPNDYVAFAPKWAEDSKKILFSIKKKNTQDIYNTLMLADINYESTISATSISLVSNNVFKGFIK